jgi:hypothetical protein
LPSKNILHFDQGIFANGRGDYRSSWFLFFKLGEIEIVENLNVQSFEAFISLRLKFLRALLAESGTLPNR